MNRVDDFGLCGAAVRISKDDLETAVRFKRRAERALLAMDVRFAIRVEDVRGWYTVVAEASDDDALARVKAVLAEVAS